MTKTARDIPDIILFLCGKWCFRGGVSGGNSEIKAPPFLTILSAKFLLAGGKTVSGSRPDPRTAIVFALSSSAAS